VKIDTIREAKHAQPFEPFEMIMKDGRIVRVTEPFAIALSPTGKTVAGYDAVGHWFYLPLAGMSKLKRPSSDGGSRRRRNGNDV
jgi:hypothetical protein